MGLQFLELILVILKGIIFVIVQLFVVLIKNASKGNPLVETISNKELVRDNEFVYCRNEECYKVLTMTKFQDWRLSSIEMIANQYQC
jgi:hypothetical protein